jgi:excisionase family DNA binding protein
MHDSHRPLSVREFARQLGLAPSTVYRAVERREIRAIRIGGRRLIPAAEAARILGGE